MKPKTEAIIRFSAAALIAVGLIWTAFNLMRAGAFFEKMRNKQEAIVKLQEIKQRNDLINDAFAVLAAVSNAAPSLSALASTAITGTVAEIREIDARPLGRGLNVKRAEIKFNEIGLNSIADFLRATETQRPPWRLTECVILSSPKYDGCGTATLTMETVAKTDAR